MSDLERVEGVVVVAPPQRKYRNTVPDMHRGSIDTRIMWLWNQRWGTVQMVWQQSPDMLDKTAATLLLQAILAKDLESIALVLQRIEGGALEDQELLEREPDTDEPAPI